MRRVEVKVEEKTEKVEEKTENEKSILANSVVFILGDHGPHWSKGKWQKEMW